MNIQQFIAVIFVIMVILTTIGVAVSYALHSLFGGADEDFCEGERYIGVANSKRKDYIEYYKEKQFFVFPDGTEVGVYMMTHGPLNALVREDGEIYIHEDLAYGLTSKQCAGVLKHEMGHRLHDDVNVAATRLDKMDKMATLIRVIAAPLVSIIIYWSQEFRADNYARKEGYGEGLISALSLFSEGAMLKPSITHPPTYLRIVAIKFMNIISPTHPPIWLRRLALKIR